MPDCMMPFPEDWHDFLKDYSFDDSQEVYTNGSRLIPVFRVEQLIKHLLKAQEPRVMTLEEYEAWIDTPFTERNPVFHEERTKRGTPVTCWVNTAVCTLREYGKNDRCWTSRPTDEQREVVKWDG